MYSVRIHFRIRDPEVNPFPYMWDASKQLHAPNIDAYNIRNEETNVLPPNTNFFTLKADSEFDPVDFTLNHGSFDQRVVQQRQQLLDELISVQQNPESALLWRQCRELGELHTWLREKTKDPKRSTKENPVFATRIELYRRDQAKPVDANNPKKGYVPDSFRVWELPKVSARSYEAARLFADTYASTLPLLAPAIDGYIAGRYGCTDPVDPSTYIATSGYERPGARQTQLDAAAVMARQIADLETLAEVARTTPLSNASLHNEPRLTVIDIFQPRFKRDSQDLHSITIEGKPIVLTGESGGGKTFLLEAIEHAVRSGVAVGKAAALALEAPMILRIDCFARPNSGDGKLSAFGQEIAALERALAQIELTREAQPTGVMVFFSDEPFSGTDKDGQDELIGHFARRLRQLGVMAVMTTHADVSSLATAGIIDPYKISLDQNAHTLEHGIGDSNAFAEARRQEFDESIIARAEELAAGAALDLSFVETKPMQVSSPLEHYGTDSPGLAWFLNTNPAFINDPELRIQERYEQYEIERRYQDVPKYKTNQIIGHDSVFSKYQPTFFLHKMMIEGGVASADILAARQDFFARLAGYPEIDRLECDLKNFQHLVFALSTNAAHNIDDNDFHRSITSPLENVGQSWLTMLSHAGTEIENYYFEDIDLRLKHAHDQDALFDLLYDTVGEIVSVDNSLSPEDAAFLTEYLAILRELTTLYRPLRDAVAVARAKDERSSYQSIPAAKTPKARLYALQQALFERQMAAADPKKPKNDEKEAPYDSFLQDLQNIFMRYDYTGGDEDTSYWDNWVEKDELSLYDLHELIASMRNTFDGPNKLFAKLVLASPNMTASKLSDFMPQIDTLYDASFDIYTQDNDRRRHVPTSPHSRSLAIMRFVAKKHNPVDELRDHFLAIGGTIATDLARYIDTNTRAFFAGKSDGTSYKKFVQKAVKHGKSASLPIGNVFQPSFGGKTRQTPYTEVSTYLHLLGMAKSIRNDTYAMWQPAETTTIEKARNVDHPTYVTADISYPKGGIDIISGANMSGKTTLLRTLYAEHATAQSIGSAHSRSMTAPLYQHNIFVDRPKHDTGKGKSSFDMDIDYWKQIVETLRDAGPSQVFIDEPFSTTNSLYQENLLLASLEWLARRGHRVVVATHNHEAIARLEQAKLDPRTAVTITCRHLDTTEDTRGIHFLHTLVEGAAPSEALAVAKVLGGEAISRMLQA